MPIDWPQSGADLKASGYRHVEWADCRGCGARIAFARTPNGALMPLKEVERPLAAPEGQRYFQPHFIDCPKAKRFQKKNTKRTHAQI